MKNALKAALYTWLWSTVAGAGSAVLSYLNKCMEWAASIANQSSAVEFPDPSVLVGTLFGAFFGLLAAIIVFFIRWAQNANVLGGESPIFDKTAKP